MRPQLRGQGCHRINLIVTWRPCVTCVLWYRSMSPKKGTVCRLRLQTRKKRPMVCWGCKPSRARGAQNDAELGGVLDSIKQTPMNQRPPSPRTSNDSSPSSGDDADRSPVSNDPTAGSIRGVRAEAAAIRLPEDAGARSTKARERLAAASAENVIVAVLASPEFAAHGDLTAAPPLSKAVGANVTTPMTPWATASSTSLPAPAARQPSFRQKPRPSQRRRTESARAVKAAQAEARRSSTPKRTPGKRVSLTPGLRVGTPGKRSILTPSKGSRSKASTPSKLRSVAIATPGKVRSATKYLTSFKRAGAVVAALSPMPNRSKRSSTDQTAPEPAPPPAVPSVSVPPLPAVASVPPAQSSARGEAERQPSFRQKKKPSQARTSSRRHSARESSYRESSAGKSEAYESARDSVADDSATGGVEGTLIDAASAGNVDACRRLLEGGSTTTGAATLLDEDGQCALHHAVESGSLEVVKLLAPSPESAAALFVHDNYQMTPFRAHLPPPLHNGGPPHLADPLSPLVCPACSQIWRARMATWRSWLTFCSCSTVRRSRRRGAGGRRFDAARPFSLLKRARTPRWLICSTAPTARMVQRWGQRRRQVRSSSSDKVSHQSNGRRMGCQVPSSN